MWRQLPALLCVVVIKTKRPRRVPPRAPLGYPCPRPSFHSPRKTTRPATLSTLFWSNDWLARLLVACARKSSWRTTPAATSGLAPRTMLLPQPMATKFDAPHASPLLTLDFLSSLSRARLELLMTATTFICSLSLFVLFALFKSGIVQKFGFLRSLGVDTVLFWCFFRGIPPVLLYSLLDLGYRLGYTGIGLEHLEISLYSPHQQYYPNPYFCVVT